MTKSDHAAAHSEILQSSLYQQELGGYINSSLISSSYVGLAKEVAKVSDDPALAGQIVKSLKGGSWLASLQSLIKTHKPAGQVSF